MSGTFDRHGQLDPARGVIVSCFGKKHSGKSIMGLLLFRSYPYDRVVLDVAGDDGPVGPDVVELHGTAEDLPRVWPEHLRKEDAQGQPVPMTLRYVPDAGSPTFREDMDAVVGLVMAHGKRSGHCGILVHEIGQLAPANRTPAHTRRLLMHNRHHHVTAFFAGPRPMDIDPLVIGQSDLVYVFEMQVAADRQRVAESIGWNRRDFDAAVDDLRPHEYLRFDANQAKPEGDEEDYRLVHFPALPATDVAATKRWAQGMTGSDRSASARF